MVNRYSTVRVHRSRLLRTGLLVILAGSACAGSTVDLKPHVEPKKSAPPIAADPCEQASNNENLGTPEAAVKLYVESIAANDFGRALRAFAAHEHATRSNFTAVVSYVDVFSAGVQIAPADYPMFVEVNELRAKATMAQATKVFVYSLLTNKDPQGSQIVKNDAEIQAFVQAFVQAVNPARLARLTVTRIRSAASVGRRRS